MKLQMLSIIAVAALSGCALVDALTWKYRMDPEAEGALISADFFEGKELTYSTYYIDTDGDLDTPEIVCTTSFGDMASSRERSKEKARVKYFNATRPTKTLREWRSITDYIERVGG